MTKRSNFNEQKVESTMRCIENLRHDLVEETEHKLSGSTLLCQRCDHYKKEASSSQCVACYETYIRVNRFLVNVLIKVQRYEKDLGICAVGISCMELGMMNVPLPLDKIETLNVKPVDVAA